MLGLEYRFLHGSIMGGQGLPERCTPMRITVRKITLPGKLANGLPDGLRNGKIGIGGRKRYDPLGLGGPSQVESPLPEQGKINERGIE